VKEVSWEIKNYSLEYEMKKELIPMNGIVPQFYGLPKIHKKNIPLPSIVNTIGSPT
jgi:hypothetical protein